MKSPVCKRGGSSNWYVRVQVPFESQKVIGKKEVWRSLGTPDRKLAAKLAHAKIAEVEREIELAVAAGPKLATRDDIEAAARRFYHYEVESDAEERVHDVDFVRERMQANSQGYRPYVERLRKALASMDYTEVEEDAEFVLGYEELTLDKEAPLYREFLQLLMRARVQAASRWMEHDEAIFGEDSGDKFFRVAPEPRPVVATSPVKRETLMSLYEKYAAARATTIKGNTIDERRNTVLRFSQFVGLARDPVSVTRPEARAWRELLKEWPKYADQAQEFEGQDFKQVLATNKRVGRPAISVRTLNKYVTDLSAFFDWLVREDHVEKNIFDGLALETPDAEQSNHSFSDRQIQHFFRSPLFVGCLHQDDIRGLTAPGNLQIWDWRYWMPIIALFSGARMGEIAQLEVSDILEEKGLSYFYFTNVGTDPQKSLKTKTSKRRVNRPGFTGDFVVQ
jgi:integrase